MCAWAATGAAFLLMHRDALETVAVAAADAAAPWFRESAIGAPLSLLGEDLTFCLRCAAAGVPVHVHTGVQVGPYEGDDAGEGDLMANRYALRLVLVPQFTSPDREEFVGIGALRDSVSDQAVVQHPEQFRATR